MGTSSAGDQLRIRGGIDLFSLDERRSAFDQLADAYDKYRPTYPKDVPDDVAFLAGLRPDSGLLEIGCGTGQLTTAFASRGYPILVLEPSGPLRERAQQNCAAFPRVRFEGTTFENWRMGSDRFDLVYAAQSFHFLDPATRFRRVADALNPGGALAVIWNYRLPGSDAAHRAVVAAYSGHAPSGFVSDQGRLIDPFEDVIDESGLFGAVFMRKYRWAHVYTTATFVGLMASHSTHQLLPEAVRTALLQSVGEGIDRAGGTITVEYDTRLYVARRLPTP